MVIIFDVGHYAHLTRLTPAKDYLLNWKKQEARQEIVDQDSKNILLSALEYFIQILANILSAT